MHRQTDPHLQLTRTEKRHRPRTSNLWPQPLQNHNACAAKGGWHDAMVCSMHMQREMRAHTSWVISTSTSAACVYAKVMLLHHGTHTSMLVLTHACCCAVEGCGQLHVQRHHAYTIQIQHTHKSSTHTNPAHTCPTAVVLVWLSAATMCSGHTHPSCSYTHAVI